MVACRRLSFNLDGCKEKLLTRLRDNLSQPEARCQVLADRDAMKVLLFQEDYSAIGLDIAFKAAADAGKCTLELSESLFPDVVRFHRAADFVTLCLAPEPNVAELVPQDSFDWDWPEEDASVWRERISCAVQALTSGGPQQKLASAACLAEWAETRCDARETLASFLGASHEFQVLWHDICRQSMKSPAAMSLAFPLALCLKFSVAAPGDQDNLAPLMRRALETPQLPNLIAHALKEGLGNGDVPRESSACTDASTTDTEGPQSDKLQG